ncbi:hypothetical protein RclHR1_19090002 [Rhizophagus clarus]|uniref:Protein kinase domain-containing protein n=1 Tax=Rhizophagus clarus TaxID=94130 RepID=A0A2Z6QQH1_9GLOM|nr:hypothetical protein RclHR1_19090002 [Rhizophagus clarus]
MEFLTTDLADFGDLTAGKKIITENFKNWTSGNEIIDNFIQEKQLKYDGKDAIFKWIRYSELIDIKEIEDNCLITAILKDGLLYYCECENEWIKTLYEKVVLRFLYDLQNVVDEFTNKIESYLKYERYGISQNPDKKVYVLVFSNIYLEYYCETCGNEYKDTRFKWGKSCHINHLKNNFTNWTSENEIIDGIIRRKQLKIEYYNTVFEWISYDKLINIEEIEGNRLITAIWKDGPLRYDTIEKRTFHEKVVLRILYDLQNVTDEFTNKIYLDYYCEECGNEYENCDKWCKPCQIDHLKSNFEKWTSGNEKIDGFIQKMQLNINHYYDTVFEWIPYNEFIGIEEVGKGTIIHKWMSTTRSLWVISNPDTQVYILVLYGEYFKYYCENCGNRYEDNYSRWFQLCQINNLKISFTNWTSGNVKIDNFIQKKQSKFEYNIVFEWIPYNNLTEIKEIDREDGFTTAIWKDGPLIYVREKGMMRESYKKVGLKYLHDLQGINDEFLNEIESFIKDKTSYGLSKIPGTKIYILIFDNKYFDNYCIECGEAYKISWNKWCKSCQANHLKSNFTNWTSGNEKIDDFIQKLLLKIGEYDDAIFEWIPYNRFIDIKEIRKGLTYSIENSYGITQNPNIKSYMVVYKIVYNCEICGEKFNKQFEVENKSCMFCQMNHENTKISDLIQEMKSSIDYNTSKSNMIFDWIPYDQFSDIEEIGIGGFSTVYSAMWEDGLLYYDECWKRKSNTKCCFKMFAKFTEFS